MNHHDTIQSWKKSSLCQRNNLNVKVKSLLFSFLTSFLSAHFLLLKYCSYLLLLLFDSALFRCNENFIKQKFFIPVGSFCSVCIKNVHVLVREMRRRRMKGTRKCCISYFCSVCSLNSQIERSTSEWRKKKKIGRKNLFIAMHFFIISFSSAGIFISFILFKFKNPQKQIAFDIVCTKNFNLRQWVFSVNPFKTNKEIKKNKQLAHKIHKNAKKARKGGKRKFSIYLELCQASTSKTRHRNNKRKYVNRTRQKERNK